MSAVAFLLKAVGFAVGSVSILLLGPRPTLAWCDAITSDPTRKSNVKLNRYDAIIPAVNLIGWTYVVRSFYASSDSERDQR
jgi:hypothetical protein